MYIKINFYCKAMMMMITIIIIIIIIIFLFFINCNVKKEKINFFKIKNKKIVLSIIS